MVMEPAEAVIDLPQLLKNIEVVRHKIGKGVNLLFAVKGNAYGHGAIEVAETAERSRMVDYLGVDNVAEARMLRHAAVKLPVLIMGLPLKKHLKEMVKLGVSITVSDTTLARSLNKESSSQHVRTQIHVNMDTGMGRMGIFPDKAVSFFRELHNLPYLQVKGVFSHLSAAYSDDPTDEEYSLRQIKKFNQVLKNLDKANILPPLRHIGNSGGSVRYFDRVTTGFYNMVRLGGLLYGHYTDLLKDWAQEIKPILSLTTEIAAIREVPCCHYIGYMRTHKTDSVRRIAILPIGYGHGLDQRLSNCGKVAINKREAAIVGLISMGQTMVDVTDVEDAHVGDEVEIIGPKLPASQMAQQVGIFSSAILASIPNSVKRVYKGASH